MKAQALAPDIQVELFEIGTAMKKEGLASSFIVSAVLTALEFEGVYDLMKLWSEEGNKNEKNEILADIQEMIDECTQKEKKDRAYIRFDDLDQIALNIRRFKDKLREVVDAQGGVQKLAEQTGIPQPSLSRFFNSNTMPRRTTLYKIATAMGISEVEIATEWSR